MQSKRRAAAPDLGTRAPAAVARDASDASEPGVPHGVVRRGIRLRGRRPSERRRPSGQRMSAVIAIDAGTTGVRAFAVGADGRPIAWSYREFPQHFPKPGWVEHDAGDIWRVTVETL